MARHVAGGQGEDRMASLCKELFRLYEDRLPVVVARASSERALPNLAKNRFLVPPRMTVATFANVVRKKLALPPERALFLFAADAAGRTRGYLAAAAGVHIAEEYARHASADRMLYLVYQSEAVFGGLT